MAHQYKDLAQTAKNVSLSVTISILSEFDSLVAEFDTDRSKLMVALISYLKVNRNDKRFKLEVQKLLKHE